MDNIAHQKSLNYKLEEAKKYLRNLKLKNKNIFNKLFYEW